MIFDFRTLSGHSIQVPAWAFKPDSWNKVFLRGLTEIVGSWEGKSVWEVGVGTGANIVELLPRVKNARWHFSDYDPRCVPLALQNLSAHVNGGGLFPLNGSWNLTTPPAGSSFTAPMVDVIFGCLPQVPSVKDLSVDDNLSHYYDPNLYPEASSHHLGLGLVESLLHRARKVLNPGGTVVLNLGGRPGLTKLRQLFEDAGYQAKVISEETIPQHAGTSLASLAALENNGHHVDFEFYANQECTLKIGAQEAEVRRLNDDPLFHKIYVMEGTLV